MYSHDAALEALNLPPSCFTCDDSAVLSALAVEIRHGLVFFDCFGTNFTISLWRWHHPSENHFLILGRIKL